MRLRALGLLCGSLALAGCIAAGPPQRGAQTGGYYPGSPFAAGGPVGLGPAPGARPNAADRSVALLLPLTGVNSGRAQGMLRAAQLAFDQPGAPRLDVRDTGGSPTGAATAAQQAIDAHDAIIVGPLTNAETTAVAGVSRAAGVPVLAFTSDPTRAQPGVWVLGLTPVQQIRRLVAAVLARGATAASGSEERPATPRFAALLPENELGRAMADALNDAVASAGAQPPTIRRYSPGMTAMSAAVRDLSGFSERQAPADSSPDQSGGSPPVAPPPFDALLLAETGPALAQLVTLLPYYRVDIPPVRVLGPALWAAPATHEGAGAALNGAWYAAPDPAARQLFERLFTEKYGAAPGPLTDLVYDAASLARLVLQQGGDIGASLTRPEGFSGADGLLGLQPDGRVRRGLALFELRGGTAGILEPAPQSFVPGT